MRDPRRIEPMLQAIRQAWHAHPDYRLTQLLKAAAWRGGWKQDDLFHLEDDKTLEGLRQLAHPNEERYEGKTTES